MRVAQVHEPWDWWVDIHDGAKTVWTPWGRATVYEVPDDLWVRYEQARLELDAADRSIQSVTRRYDRERDD